MKKNNSFSGQAFRIALKVAAYYGIFGVIWIIGTDLLVTNLPLAPGQMQMVQSLKGIIFVLLSLTVVFLAVWKEGRHAEKISRELSTEEQRLSAIIEGTNAGTWEWDFESNEIEINDQLAETLGYSKKDLHPLTPRSFFDSIHPEDLEKTKKTLKRHIRGELEFYSDEIRLRHEDGRWIWGHLIGKVTNWSEEDKPLVMSGSMFDVTERKEAREKLLKSKKRFEELAELLPQPVWETDEKGNFTYVNRAGLEAFGYSPSDLEDGLRITDVFPAEDVERASRNFQRVLDGERISSSEYLALKSGGTKSPVLVYSSPITEAGEIVGIRGITIDISDQKDIQRRLEEQKQERSILLRNLPGMAYKCENDRSWTMKFVSEGCEDLTGYAPEEIVDNTLVAYGDLVLDEDKRFVWEEVQKSLNNKQPFELEYRIKTREGKVKWVWERGRGLYGQDGELENIHGFISDVTERKKMETDLRKSEKKFRSYVENAPLGVFVADEKAQYVEVNEAATDMTGYSRSELLDMEVPDLHPDRVMDKAQHAFQKLLDEGEMKVELPYLARDGTEGQMVLKAVEISENRYLGFSLDVTERKEAEEKLEQATLGTLQALNRTIEAKDEYTGKHIDRVQKYSVRVGERVGLSDERLEQIKYASILHDIGKIGVPDSILGKPDELTEDEWDEMEKHPRIGEMIVGKVGQLERAAKIIGQHQEHYDGSGYPRGLSGEELTLEARIIAVVDAWDAMRTDRPYRKALSRNEAVRELKENAGTQFDPEIVEIFLDMIVTDNH